MSTTVLPPTDVRLPGPTRARYVVLGFLCSMAFVLYLDRVCISQALVPMQDEFGLTNTQTSYVLMAFTLAYGLFEIPTGRWGDRFGSRRVLTRIVLWWSLFTALTGGVWSFTYEVASWPVPLVINSLVLLIAIRFLFGAGEAGAIPNAARILKHWFSSGERGRMQGLFQASMHVGGMVAPIVAAVIIKHAGWRWTFVAFGMIGVVWALLFYWWFRDHPAEHGAVNQAELQLIDAHVSTDSAGHGSVPWGEALLHPNVWLLGVTVTMSAFNSYFFFSWYATYLQKARIWDGEPVSNEAAGWLAAIALAGATGGSLLGGWFSDLITRHASDRYRARRWLCLGSFFGAAAFLYGSVLVDHPLLSAFFCGLACLWMFTHLPTWWACSFEVSGRHTGSMFGLLNGIGIVGAMGSQYFFGAFVDWRAELGFEGRERWDPAFYASIALLITAGILWQFIRQRPAIGEASLPSPPPVEPIPDDKMKTAIREGPPR
jgi:MFS transporter, ACS family, glucarate transporter